MIGRKIFGLALVALSLSMLAAIFVNIPPSVAAAATPTIALVGYINAWNFTTRPNPTITVTQGDTVTLQLSTADTTHRFFIDVDRNGPSPDCPGTDICSNLITPSTVLTFTVKFAPGDYTYYCSLHPTTMLGQFKVLQPPPVTGGGRPPLQE